MRALAISFALVFFALSVNAKEHECDAYWNLEVSCSKVGEWKACSQDGDCTITTSPCGFPVAVREDSAEKYQTCGRCKGARMDMACSPAPDMLPTKAACVDQRCEIAK